MTEVRRTNGEDPYIYCIHRHDERMCVDCFDGLFKEMEFYRSLTISREEGVTAIDGGKTAEKLHVLWEAYLENEHLKEALRRYGVHDPECQPHGEILRVDDIPYHTHRPPYRTYTPNREVKCICGLNKALGEEVINQCTEPGH